MTEEPMTVDAMDRETERLRGEKRRAMAALRAGGRGGDGPGGPAAMEPSQPSKESSPPNPRPAGGKCERPVEETPPADALRAVRTSSGAATPSNATTQSSIAATGSSCPSTASSSTRHTQETLQ